MASELMVKTCSKCNEEKPLEFFGKDAQRKDGLRLHCKACAVAHDKAWREANKEKKAAINKAYREANKEKEAAYSKAYWEANKEKEAARNKAYRDANKEKVAARNKAYRDTNKEKVAASRKAWRESHPYQHSATTAKGRAKRYNALPSWYSQTHHDQIIGIYEERDRITQATGVQHEVDHILPLNGDTVSGLHIPDNLQIITRTENKQKGNKYDCS